MICDLSDLINLSNQLPEKGLSSQPIGEHAYYSEVHNDDDVNIYS